MKGDFSRDSFNRLKHFRRVMMQQGRVQLDSDWNEQVSILLHYMQTLAADILGPYAGPEGGNFGFAITRNPDNSVDFKIGKGRYYVNGILCENDDDHATYLKQHGLSESQREFIKNSWYIAYLDVWERHVSHLEDDDIREKALGGPDTATRTKTVWQVKVKKLLSSYVHSYCLGGAQQLDNEVVISKAYLRARAKLDQENIEPCLVEPKAKYRGPENQLYRIEVHDGGCISDNRPPTFKWSRENGCVAFRIKGIRSEGSEAVVLELENLGRDNRFGLAVGDWVEIEDDTSDLKNEAGPLLRVQHVDRADMTVTLKKTDAGEKYSCQNALLRRWDQKKTNVRNGAVLIDESDSDLDIDWMELENGIKIQFKPDGIYRKGDHWLIPARTASGDVEWPQDENGLPIYKPPHGILHHLAPLATIYVNPKGQVEVKHDCRCRFQPLSYYCVYSHYGQLGIGVDLLCPE